MASRGISFLVYEFIFASILFSSLTIRETETFSSTYSAKVFSANVTQLLDSLLANYDKRIRPGHGAMAPSDERNPNLKGPPTAIIVNMNVRSMGPFSEKQESYAMQLYLRHVWYDSRLKFNKALWGRSEFSMNWKFADRIWKPDTFFINGKNSYFHRITAPNMFIRLRHDGQITWSMRLTVRATCLMHLRKFPLDTQHCPLRMASYGYNAQDLIYKWDPKQTVTVDSDVSIAQYELMNVTTEFKKVTIRRKEIISTLTVTFHLRRQTGFFLLQVYIPCILIVCCSWVAFWITKKDVPGRVGLGVTTVLSMTTIGFGGRTSPPVSYATALDYFVILCFAFVFAAVLEFAFINFVERAANKRRKKMDDLRREIKERITAEKATMIVTTKIEEGKPIVKETLRQMLKMPLSAVPLADEEAIIEIPEEPSLGDTKEGYKSLIKVPLTVLPHSSDMMKEELEFKDDEESSYVEERRRKATLTRVTSSIIDIMKAGVTRHHRHPSESGTTEEKYGTSSSSLKGETKHRSESKGEKEKVPSIVVDVSEEDEEPEPPPPPKQVTIWQLLMQKRKLMATMTPAFIIPGEEEILDKFSIVDLYSRRIFPSLFFFFTSLYWILFNYYITDEFPSEKRTPTDGLIVT